jgi:hypothetical protein
VYIVRQMADLKAWGVTLAAPEWYLSGPSSGRDDRLEEVGAPVS